MASSFHVSLPADEARLIEESARHSGTSAPQLIRNRLREWYDLRQIQNCVTQLENRLDAIQFLLEIVAIDAASEANKSERQATIEKINQRLNQLTVSSTQSQASQC